MSPSSQNPQRALAASHLEQAQPAQKTLNSAGTSGAAVFHVSDVDEPGSDTAFRMTLGESTRGAAQAGPGRNNLKSEPLRVLKFIIKKLSWFCVLLPFIPVALALHYAFPKPNSVQNTLTFVSSFLAIIPLAQLLSEATEELADHIGGAYAGLTNATLGNVVELIVAILALKNCELEVVKSSLIGSVLSNLLLVLGMCFFAGGWKYSEQGFVMSAAQVNSSLLMIAVAAILIPGGYHFAVGDANSSEVKALLSISHGMAIIMLLVYGGYLYFQLGSHQRLFDEKNPREVFRSTLYKQIDPDHSEFADSERVPQADHQPSHASSSGHSLFPATIGVNSVPSVPPSPMSATNPLIRSRPQVQVVEIKEEDEETLSVRAALIILVLTTVIVAFTAEGLVGSIDGLTKSGDISKEFVGLILLPIAGNAAEHVSAVWAAWGDNLTLSLSVAVGSSLQISLFVIPFTMVVAWGMHKPLTMLFDPLESLILLLSVIVVNYTVQDGKSNWAEGMILMSLYAILAVVFWFYPGVSIADSLVQC